MSLSVKQGQVITQTLNGPQRFIILDGAIRSGKTFSTLIAWVTIIASGVLPGPFAMIGKTRDTIQRNIVEPLQMLDPNVVTHVTKRSSTIEILGQQVHLISAADEAAESKIRGLTLAAAYIDEATLLPESFFVQLTGRLSVPGAVLLATTNPDSPAHWLKTKYIDRATELGWGYHRFTMDDNPSLTPEYIEAKKREFTGLWYRRFIQGEWVSAEGAVYNMWDQSHITPWEETPQIRELLAVGMDYGTTNATAAVLLAQARNGHLYAVDEWRVDSTDTTRYTDGELSKGFINWLARDDHYPKRERQSERMRPRYVALDPAAASLRAQLAQDGISNQVRADNNVTAGIALVATGLSEGWLHITDHCPSLIREFPGYSWDPKATAMGADKPIKTADHSLDALRYAVSTVESLWRPHLTK